MHAMGVASLLAFSLLVCSSITVYGAHHTASSPAAPPRKKVVVEGSVFCIFCVMEGGPGSVSKSALLPGAVVKLQCNNTNKGWEEETTTDNNGSFSFMPKRVSTWGAHKCKVFLLSSPRKDCPILNSFNHGDSGAVLKPSPNNTTSSSHSQLYSVGPFAFHPGPFMCV